MDPLKVSNVSIPIAAPAQIAPPAPVDVVSEESIPVPLIPSISAPRKPVARSLFATPSILDALSDLPKDSNLGEIADPIGDVYGDSMIEKPFELAQLLVAWLTFVSAVEAPQLKSALSAREPQIVGEWEILYELDTELQYNRLTLDLKPKLLGFLRRKLENQAIEITFKVSDDLAPKSDIPYTDEEKWNVLVGKYPSLALLKSKFGLDFEHY